MNDTLRLILFCGAGAWALMSLYKDFKDPVRRRKLFRIFYWHSAIGIPLAVYFIYATWTTT